MAVVFRGVEEVRRALQEWARDAEKAVDADALSEAAEIAVDAAKVRAPVRTGRLRDSITASPAKSRSGKPTVLIGPSKAGKAFYGRMLEFGTSKMSARPWLRPALRSVRKEINDALASSIGKKLKTRTRGKFRKKT